MYSQVIIVFLYFFKKKSSNGELIRFLRIPFFPRVCLLLVKMLFLDIEIKVLKISFNLLFIFLMLQGITEIPFNDAHIALNGKEIYTSWEFLILIAAIWNHYNTKVLRLKLYAT